MLEYLNVLKNLDSTKLNQLNEIGVLFVFFWIIVSYLAESDRRLRKYSGRSEGLNARLFVDFWTSRKENVFKSWDAFKIELNLHWIP